MLVKILIENTAGKDLHGEHGLCFYVEYRGKKYLIDSGASGLFAENADRMGVNLADIDMAFLSHAHYDHSGGYPDFFARNRCAKVYLQKRSKDRHYFKIAGPIKKYIGIPEGMLDKYADRFLYIDGSANVSEGIHIIHHTSDRILERAKHTHMFVAEDGKTELDDFSHEQTIVFEEEDGLICFNSCSHSGVDIVIEAVRKAFPDKEIKAYFGGFHMMGITGAASCSYQKEDVQEVAHRLMSFSKAKFYSGHCTGMKAYVWLKGILGDRLDALQSGKVIEL